MTWAAVAGAAVSVVGGALVGGSGSSGPQTQGSSTQTLDPRMQQLLYDGDFKGGGLLGDVEKLRKEQMAQGGLNPLQRSGMEMQRQSLMDPRYTQGYDQMRNQGSALMGAPVAQNPFSNGYQGGTNFNPQRPPGQSAPAVPNLGMGSPQQQNPATAAAFQPIPQAPAAPPPQAMPAAPTDPKLDPEYLRRVKEEQAYWAAVDTGNGFSGGI